MIISIDILLYRIVEVSVNISIAGFENGYRIESWRTIWFTPLVVTWCYLQRAELLYDLRDGVDGLGVRQQTGADGSHDVEGTLQQLSGMSSIHLPRPVDALHTVPAETHTSHQDQSTIHYTCALLVKRYSTLFTLDTVKIEKYYCK